MDIAMNREKVCRGAREDSGGDFLSCFRPLFPLFNGQLRELQREIPHWDNKNCRENTSVGNMRISKILIESPCRATSKSYIMNQISHQWSSAYSSLFSTKKSAKTEQGKTKVGRPWSRPDLQLQSQYTCRHNGINYESSYPITCRGSNVPLVCNRGCSRLSVAG